MLKIDYLKEFDDLFVDALHEDFLLFQKQKQKNKMFCIRRKCTTKNLMKEILGYGKHT